MEAMDGSALPITVLVQEQLERLLLDVSRAAWHERHSEWGGLLFGRTYESYGCRVVWVAAAVPGIGSGTPVSFELDPLSYVLAQRLLRRDRRAHGLEEIGFWHSHPHLQVYPSRTDAEYHAIAFPEYGSLSMILDPFAPVAAVYANTEGGVVPVPAYSFAGDAFGHAPDVPPLRPWDSQEVRDVLS